jgi:acylphosphatase
MIAVNVTVHGRVQGVFYRDWTVRNARELGLSGWVCNQPDGTVAALLQGDEAAVRQMIERMRSGPPRAQVERIDEARSEGEAVEGFNRR